MMWAKSGPLFAKKTPVLPSYGYRNPHYKTQMVRRPSQVYNGNRYTDKIMFSWWTEAQECQVHVWSVDHLTHNFTIIIQIQRKFWLCSHLNPTQVIITKFWTWHNIFFFIWCAKKCSNLLCRILLVSHCRAHIEGSVQERCNSIH